MILNSDNDFDASFKLASGRVLMLEKLTQARVYAGLLEGTPDKRMNDELIAEAIARARKEPLGEQQPRPRGFINWALGRLPLHNAPDVPVCLVAPERRDYDQVLGDMQHVLDRQKDYPPNMQRIPEWLPQIVCEGEFRSFEPARDMSRHMSYLTIVWYQEAFGISRADLEKLRDVDWERHAADGDY